MANKYDFVIIGAGPAGLSAAMYAARYKLKTLVIGEMLGGTVNVAHIVENYPGFLSIKGPALVEKFVEHARKHKVRIITDSVSDIDRAKKRFILKTGNSGEFEAKAILFATGSQRKKLNVEGEEKLLGKGISYCATCDAAFFKGKDVAVIGGSDAAVKSALILSEYAKKVMIIYRRSKLRAEPIMVEKILKNPKIEVIYGYYPKKVVGEKMIESILIAPFEKEGKAKAIKLDGVFIEIGEVPSTSLAKDIGISLEKNGSIIVDNEMKTNIPGVYAAGDIVNTTDFRQIIIASAQGSLAAYSAYKHLRGG